MNPRFGAHIFFLLTLSLGFLILACDQNKQTPPAERRPLSNKHVDDTANPLAANQTLSRAAATSPSMAEAGKEGFYLAADEAQASVQREVSLVETAILPGLKAPELLISRQKADFIQLLRCASSYELLTLSGEKLKHVQGRANQASELEWAWAQALEDERYCKLVGSHINTASFQDLTAPKGEYFYVINPCISKEHAVTNKEGCSFDLMLTHTVTIDSSLRKEIQEKNIELAQAESALNAQLENARQLARKIELHLRACEDMVASDQQVLNFKKGLVKLGVLVGAATIGNAIGGPNMAVMLGYMTTAMATEMFIFPKLLKWPQIINNECINPNVVATTAEQRKAADKNDKTHISQYAGKYEEEFQVQALIKRFEKIVTPETGLIAQESKRVQKILEELQELDVKVLTVDAAFAKAANLGIDINNPDSLAPATSSPSPFAFPAQSP